MDYTPRVLDLALDELLPELAAIAIEGAKGVGKTATAERRCAAMVDLTKQSQREVIAADPGVILTQPKPTLVDEWQLAPETWDRVRRAVDSNRAAGQFILTGSAWPTAKRPVHSGAGRIAGLQMRPLNIYERHLDEPTVSTASLLAGAKPQIGGQAKTDLAGYAEEIVASGFPGIRDLGPRARRLQLDSYLDRAVDRDMEQNGTAVRRPGELLAWLRSYAAATGSTASQQAIADAATPGQTQPPSRQTASRFSAALERQFLLDPLPSWVPSMSPFSRLTMGPKHHLVDPALAARLLGADVSSLLRGQSVRTGPTASPLLGALFESLAVQTVRVLAENAEARAAHLRTRGGEHELDLILENADWTVVAIEVKLKPVITAKDTKNLKWLANVIPERIADLAVITTGQHAYRREDGIAVIPLSLLGP
ncbi:MAG: DUF4143 domain-containing protein [Bifidobacteriaceae bacterium]|jgi:predicted AAA+ superfamily ATPase|nr:DUF4143 domain-containing protein [Bifidobacteriaceae bacterium]